MKPLRATVVAALLLLLPAAASEGSPAPAPGTVELSYEVYAGGFFVATGRFVAELHPDRFDARFAIVARGLPALLKKFRLQAQVNGLRAWNEVQPLHYRNEYWKKERLRRWVEIDYTDNSPPAVEAVPPPWEDERAAVPARLRVDTLDPVSAALALADKIGRDGRCRAALDVYDGRRLFRVRLEHLGLVEIRASKRGPYRGPAMKCRMTLDKVVGFEDDELHGHRYPETLIVVLAPVVPGGPWIPTRFEADNLLGKLIVRLVSVQGQGLETQGAKR